MKKTLGIFAIFTLMILGVAFITPSKAEAYSYRVNGYYRSSGTYVQPYYRTSPDSYKWNNYSYKGNYNPYSGNYGTRNYYWGR